MKDYKNYSSKMPHMFLSDADMEWIEESKIFKLILLIFTISILLLEKEDSINIQMFWTGFFLWVQINCT